MGINLQPLTPDKLEVFEALLGAADFGGCFCAVWTGYSDDWAKRCADPARPNLQLTAKSVRNGLHTGFLVYEDDQLVGWTGAGPKTAFPLLKTKLGSRLSECSSRIWSIGCITVAKEHRGRGLSDLIVQAVCEKARELGAEMVESYPVRPFDEPRIYRGTEKLYRRSGFQEVGSEKDGEADILLMRVRLE